MNKPSGLKKKIKEADTLIKPFNVKSKKGSAESINFVEDDFIKVCSFRKVFIPSFSFLIDYTLFLCSLFTIITNTFSQSKKSKYFPLNNGYLFRYVLNARLPLRFTVLTQYCACLVRVTVLTLHSNNILIFVIISNKLSLFKLTVFLGANT